METIDFSLRPCKQTNIDMTWSDKELPAESECNIDDDCEIVYAESECNNNDDFELIS